MMVVANSGIPRTVDFSERLFFARCLASFSGDKLQEFLDFLSQLDPNQFAVRRGGESFHIDFASLSEETFSKIRSFICKRIDHLEEEDDELYLASEIDSKPREEPQDLISSTSQHFQEPKQKQQELPPVPPPPSSISSTSSRRTEAASRFINGTRRFRTWEKQVFFPDENDNRFSVTLLGTSVETTRPYICNTCEASFVSKNKCVDHIRYIHAQVFQVTCEVCSARLKNKHYLKEHMKRRHPPSSELAVNKKPHIVMNESANTFPSNGQVLALPGLVKGS